MSKEERIPKTCSQGTGGAVRGSACPAVEHYRRREDSVVRRL